MPKRGRCVKTVAMGPSWTMMAILKGSQRLKKRGLVVQRRVVLMVRLCLVLLVSWLYGLSCPLNGDGEWLGRGCLKGRKVVNENGMPSQ